MTLVDTGAGQLQLEGAFALQGTISFMTQVIGGLTYGYETARSNHA